MKKLLFIPLLFACYIGMGQAINSASIIGKPISIGNLQIAQFDFPERLNFDAAVKACAELGKGWRLPTKKELNELYRNKEKIGGFQTKSIRGFIGAAYFSSTFDDDGSSWVQFFTDGTQYSGLNNTSMEYAECFVRAVKTIN